MEPQQPGICLGFSALSQRGNKFFRKTRAEIWVTDYSALYRLLNIFYNPDDFQSEGCIYAVKQVAKVAPMYIRSPRTYS